MRGPSTADAEKTFDTTAEGDTERMLLHVDAGWVPTGGWTGANGPLAPSEAGLIGRWQRGVRSGLDGATGIRAILCAITCYVATTEAAGFGARIRELAESDHPGGICRVDAADHPAEWVD